MSYVAKLDRIIAELQSLRAELAGSVRPAGTAATGVLDKPPKLTDTNWPIATSIQTPKTRQEKEMRAICILDLLPPYAGLKVLDFGCGEGYLASELAQGREPAAKVVAYDHEEPPQEDDGQTPWQRMAAPTVHYLSDLAAAKTHGPYELIILFDVVDHLSEDPVKIMTMLGQWLAPKGKIFCRCHPWTARHGGHVYDTINKAFIHLAFTAEELAEEGITIPPLIQVTRPLATYESWWKKAKLAVEQKWVRHSEELWEPFFDQLLPRIIHNTWPDGIEEEQVKRIMSISFVDYLLRR